MPPQAPISRDVSYHVTVAELMLKPNRWMITEVAAFSTSYILPEHQQSIKVLRDNLQVKSSFEAHKLPEKTENKLIALFFVPLPPLPRGGGKVVVNTLQQRRKVGKTRNYK